MTRLARAAAATAGWVLVVLLLGWPGSAMAHPHVFVDYTVTLLLSADAIDGIRFTWTFDDLFSGLVLQEFDTDRNQAFSSDEARRIEQRHLVEFQKVGFHATINVDGKPVAVPAARGFRASVAKGIVTYEFVLPVKAPLATTTALEIVVDDPVYYIAYTATGVTPQSQTIAGQTLDCRVARDPTGAAADAVRCGVRRR